MTALSLRRASDKSPVSLGEMLGKGGEGAVFPVVDAPDIVAKIYHEPPAPSKVEKLAAMARNTTPRLLRVAAWPTDLLMDDRDVVRGFLMPKVAAREDVHELYSPKSRRQEFPYADFRFIVGASANIARAIATVHLHGHVIGDINHGNALIGRDGTVVLIDCDSFQIHDGARDFTCDVGVALFTPPELHGKHFRGLQRSPDHDAFGLAVMLFHLLYAGRHPFAGLFATGEMPIERAIAESRFPYGRHARVAGMTPPPGALPLNTFGSTIADLFERAFGGSVARPPAAEWVTALGALQGELTRCGSVPLHVHPRGAECCWCELEAATGMTMFGAFDAGLPVPASQLQTLWREIVATPRPPEVPRTAPGAHERDVSTEMEPPDRIRAEKSTSARSEGGLGCVTVIAILIALALAEFTYFGGGLGIVALVVGIVALANWRGLTDSLGDDDDSSDRARDRLRKTLRTAEHRLSALLNEWSRTFSKSAFDSALEDLDADREELVKLPETRRRQLEALREKTALRNRDACFRRFSIESAGFSWCGPEQASMLAGRGLRTAADVMHAAGTLHRYLDDAAAAELQAWYEARAAELVVDPNEPMDPREVADLEESLRERREVLLKRLREGPARLQGRSDEIVETRDRLLAEIDVARETVRIARSELDAYE